MKTTPYPVQNVKNYPHRYTELFKIQVAVIIDIRQVPDPLELIIAQTTVLEHGSGLLAR